MSHEPRRKEQVMSESKSASHTNYDPAMLEKHLGPLGLLPSFETSTETKEKLEKLEKFSLDREMRCLRGRQELYSGSPGDSDAGPRVQTFHVTRPSFPQSDIQFCPIVGCGSNVARIATRHQKVPRHVCGGSWRVCTSQSARSGAGREERGRDNGLH